MIDGGYPMGNPIASSFVVLDLIPVVMFEIEFDWEIRAFKEDKVSDVVSYFQPGSVFQVSSGNVTIPSSSDWHSGPEVFTRCHDW